MLTKRQHELLSFLITYQSKNAISPSYEEMRDALHLRSKSAVHALVEGLEKRGYCRKVPHSARAIEILKNPLDTIPSALSHERELDLLSLEKNVPYFGLMPSATSMDFLENSQSTFMLPSSLGEESNELIALTVQGDFLKDFGILSGDVLVLKLQKNLEEEMLALVSVGHKLMLRKCSLEGGRVFLKTANRYMIPESYFLEEIKVHGKVSSLLREKI